MFTVRGLVRMNVNVTCMDEASKKERHARNNRGKSHDPRHSGKLGK